MDVHSACPGRRCDLESRRCGYPLPHHAVHITNAATAQGENQEPATVDALGAENLVVLPARHAFPALASAVVPLSEALVTGRLPFFVKGTVIALG